MNLDHKDLLTIKLAFRTAKWVMREDWSNLKEAYKNGIARETHIFAKAHYTGFELLEIDRTTEKLGIE